MSTITLYPSAEAYVDQDSPTTNFGGAGYLIMGGGNNPENAWNTFAFGTCRTWLKFDLSSLAGATINSAVLNMNAFFDYEFYGYGDLALEIWNCSNTSWAYNTITWNNAPEGSLGTQVANVTFSATPQTWQANVASSVTTYAGGLVTWRLNCGNELGYNHIVNTSYAYGLVNSLYYPRLEINYTAAAAGATIIANISSISGIGSMTF